MALLITLAASATTANNVHAIIANGTASAVDVDWNTDAPQLDGVRFWALPSPSAGGTIYRLATHQIMVLQDVNADFDRSRRRRSFSTGTLQAGATLSSLPLTTVVMLLLLFSGADDTFTARHGTVAAQGGDVYVERVDA